MPLNAVHTGAKGKFNKEIAASIIAALRLCPVLTTVAAAHGITAGALSLWRTKGAAGEKKYVDFFNESEAALHQSHFELIRDIASDPDWRAKARVLEMTAPERFGRTLKTEHTGKNGEPLPPPTGGTTAVTITLQGAAIPNPYDPSTPPFVEPPPPEETPDGK